MKTESVAHVFWGGFKPDVLQSYSGEFVHKMSGDHGKLIGIIGGIVRG